MSKREVFHLNETIETSLGFSQAVRAGNLLFVAGTVSVNDDFEVVEADDIAGQYRTIYDKLQRTLAAFGLGFDAVVKETIYTENLEAFFGEGNEVRKQYYRNLGYFPTATAVGVTRTAFDGNVVEIEIIAEFRESQPQVRTK